MLLERTTINNNTFFLFLATKDEDPSVVMGNSNATIHPTTTSTSKKGSDQQQQQQKVSELYSQREITGAVVIERNNNNNNKKSKNKTLTQSTSSAAQLEKQKLVELTKKFENRQREHEQQLDNLNNQLKERTNRIASLEEEKNDSIKLSTDLQNELALKNRELNQHEEKLKIAQYLVDKSNLSVEGLSIVLQNFINQVYTIFI